MAAAEAPLAVIEIDGLESSGVSATGDIPVLPLDELEDRVNVGAVAVERMVDIELYAAPVGAVATEVLDLTEDRVVDTTRTEISDGPATCRNCGNQQQVGNVCERCGMRIERVAETFIMGVAEDQEGRCKACGFLGIQGQPCRDCGTPIPLQVA